MSQENVEIVRRANEAANKRDVDGFVASIHPDVEFDWSESRSAAGGIVEPVIRGRDQVRAGMLEVLDMWEVTWQEEEILEVGTDEVIVVIKVRMRGREGIELVTAAH
jgi:ketosteroid isomerase-like protein